MKKSILAISLALTMLLSTSSVFASSEDLFAQNDEAAASTVAEEANDVMEIVGLEEFSSLSSIDENLRIQGNDQIMSIEAASFSEEIEMVELEEIPQKPLITKATDNVQENSDTGIQAFAAASSDSYEPNNTRQQAYNMGSLGSSYEKYIYGTLDEADGDWYYGTPNNVQMDSDWFKITVNPSDGFSGDVALRLRLMDGMDAILWLYDSNGNFITGYRGNSSVPVIIKFNRKTTARTYYCEVTPYYTANTSGYITYVAPQSDWRQYTLSLLDYSRTSSYTTGTFSPSTVSSPGQSNYSAWTTLNLTNNTAIPASAQVKSVTAQGTFKTPLGSSRIGVISDGMLHDEQILGSSSSIYTPMIGFRDSFIPARNLWGIRYMTQAYNSTSAIQNMSLIIQYKYDLFESHNVFID